MSVEKAASEATLSDRPYERVDVLVKRATYCAVAGAVIIPVIGSIFSTLFFRQAMQIDPTASQRYRFQFLFGMFVNVVVFAGVGTLLFGYFGSQF